MTSNTPNTCERYTKKAASVSETEAAFLRKMEKKIARKKSGDVGVFVAGRLLGRVETGDDVHHAASR